MSNEEQKIENNDFKDNAPVKNEDENQESSVLEETPAVSEVLEASEENNEASKNADTEQAEVKDEKSSETVVSEIRNEEKKKGFFSWLGATIVDQAVAVGITYILVFLIGIILPSFGYKISNRLMMVFAVYLVINILYNAIFNNKTVGRRIFL